MNDRKNRGAFTVYADWSPDLMPVVEKSTCINDYFIVRTYEMSDWAIHFTQDQLRSLREQITKALGESPQDESELEALRFQLHEARAALGIAEDIVSNKFNTVKT